MGWRSVLRRPRRFFPSISPRPSPLINDQIRLQCLNLLGIRWEKIPCFQVSENCPIVAVGVPFPKSNGSPLVVMLPLTGGPPPGKSSASIVLFVWNRCLATVASLGHNVVMSLLLHVHTYCADGHSLNLCKTDSLLPTPHTTQL